MRVKNAKKANLKWQKMQTTLSRNCCSKNAPKLSAVIHCLQWITAKIALKMQWDFGHSGNLQNLQGNYLQCRNSLFTSDQFFIDKILQLLFFYVRIFLMIFLFKLVPNNFCKLIFLNHIFIGL